MKKPAFPIKKTDTWDHSTDGVGVTDDELLIRQAKYKYNWADYNRRRLISKRYDIDMNNPEPGLLRWAKDKFEPFEEHEIIPREEWNLDSLNGETILQLYHPHYQRLYQHIFANHKPTHKILTIFECTNAKPYYSSVNAKLWSKRYGSKSDFAVMSNPGVIPFEYSNYYPFRMDEWDHYTETPEIEEIYTQTCMDRLIEYKNALGYEHVIVVMQAKKTQAWADRLYKENKHNEHEWLHIVTTDEYMEKYMRERLIIYKNPGMAKQRMMNDLMTKQEYEKILNKIYEQYN